MKLKKLGVMVMVFSLVVGGSIHNKIYAMEQKEQTFMNNNYSTISPYWANISDISVDISANKTTLYPETYIQAKSSTGTISGTMYLEKYVSGSWTSVTLWGVSGTGDVLLSKTYQGAFGTKYRVRVVVTVNGEREEVTSGTCTL
ncbi:MAG: hypothetical protein RSA52_01010 [Acetivibrio sp.]